MYIKDFDTFMNESVNITGNKNKDIDLIFKTCSSFLIDKIIQDNISLTIKFKPLKPTQIGYADIIDTLKNLKTKNFTITLNRDASLVYSFGAISHEITHIKQILTGELSLSKDNKYLLWLGKPYISVVDYMLLIDNNDYVKYKELPWELEAYNNQDLYPNILKDSKVLDELKGSTDTIDYILDIL